MKRQSDEEHRDKKSKSVFDACRYILELPADFSSNVALPEKGFILFDNEGESKEIRNIELNNFDVLVLMVLKGLDPPTDLKEKMVKIFSDLISRILRQ